MFARIASLVVVAVVSSPALADPPKKKKDVAAEVLAALREPVDLELKGDHALGAFADYVARKFDFPVIVNEDAFKQCGIDSIHEARVNVPGAKNLRLRTVLAGALAPKSATFLVRNDHVEILPLVTAARRLKLPDDRADEQLVSVIVKEKPLNEVAAEIAEEFDLNVVVSPQAGDARMGFVSLRLLNVPADKALDTLATAADLRVVRKGTVFFITSRDHANELFGEKLDKERQKIEVQKLREAPANPFGPLMGQPPVAPPPVPKAEEKK